MPSFHDRLNILLEEAKDKNHKITQKEFAEIIGTRPRQTVSWLNYASYPRVPVLLQIAERMNVSVSWLLGETSIRTPVDQLQSSEWSEIADRAVGLSPQARNVLKAFIDYLKLLEKEKIPQRKEP